MRLHKAKNKSEKKKKDPAVSQESRVRNINPEDLCCQIKHKAYELYENRGSGHGHDREDWFSAEQIIKKQQ
jgi:hypothetical protein